MIHNVFDHKYPIENLHELDLTWMLEELDAMRATLTSWESIIDELRAGIEQFNRLETDVIAIKAQIADLDAIRNDIRSLKSNVNSLQADVNSLNNRVDATYDYITREIVILRELINLNYNRLLNLINGLNLEIRGDIEAIKLDIQHKYLELLSIINSERPLDVYNRVAGVRLSFDDNNFNIYEDLRYLGIDNNTLFEIADNDTIASLVHDNRDFALFMKKRLKKNYLYSPLSGRLVSHANALSELCVYGFGGISNEDLFNDMLANTKTNEDIGDYYNHNMLRYSLTL